MFLVLINDEEELQKLHEVAKVSVVSFLYGRNIYHSATPITLAHEFLQRPAAVFQPEVLKLFLCAKN